MTGHNYIKPRLTNYNLFWRQRIVRNWPFLLWLAVLVFITAFYSRNQQFGQMVGTVEVIEEDVVPRETARLVSLNVEVGQSVKKGDVLAQMDTSLIDAQIAVEEATLRDARDTFNRDQRGMVAAAQQSETAVKGAETALKTEQMRQSSDAAEVAELRRELKRREDLFANHLIDEMSVNELRPKIAALEQSLAAYPKLIEISGQTWESAVKLHDAMQNCLRLDQAGNLQGAISNKTASSLSIIDASRQLALERKKSYTLRANRNGVVARVFIWSGNVVAAGIPIMHIVDGYPRTVVGFLPEICPFNLTRGQRVMVWRQNENNLWDFGDRRVVVPAVVYSIAPAVEALPVRINPMQVQIQGGQPMRGRRVIFRLLAEHDFSPGETVEIREIHEGLRAMMDRVVLLFTGHKQSALKRVPAALQPEQAGGAR